MATTAVRESVLTSIVVDIGQRYQSRSVLEDAIILWLCWRARQRVMDGWCYHRPATDGGTRTVHPCAPNARAWCALGALQAAIGEWGAPSFRRSWATAQAVALLDAMAYRRFGMRLAAVNDGLSYEAVLEVYADAIAGLTAYRAR